MTELNFGAMGASSAALAQVDFAQASGWCLACTACGACGLTVAAWSGVAALASWYN